MYNTLIFDNASSLICYVSGMSYHAQKRKKYVIQIMANYEMIDFILSLHTTLVVMFLLQ